MPGGDSALSVEDAGSASGRALHDVACSVTQQLAPADDASAHTQQQQQRHSAADDAIDLTMRAASTSPDHDAATVRLTYSRT